MSNDCELCFEPDVSRTLYRGLLICDSCRNSSEQWDCMTPEEKTKAMALYREVNQ